MASSNDVKKPKELRFTQLTIKSSFTDSSLPDVAESISLIREGKLDPKVFGELTVMKDKEGVVWCRNNRRLYVLRMAEVPSVSVKFVSKDKWISERIKDEKVKKKMNDPAFLPRIRGQVPTSLLVLLGNVSHGADDEVYSDSDADSEADDEDADEKVKKLNDRAFLPRVRGQLPSSLLVLVGNVYHGADDEVYSDGDADSEAEDEDEDEDEAEAEDKIRLKDPSFLPKIRGQMISPQPSTLVDVGEEQKGSSLLGLVGDVSAAAAATYWGWKLFNGDAKPQAAAGRDGEE